MILPHGANAVRKSAERVRPTDRAGDGTVRAVTCLSVVIASGLDPMSPRVETFPSGMVNMRASRPTGA